MARLLSDRRALTWVAGALLIYVLALAAPPTASLSHAGQAVLGVALAGVALWASEAVPLGFAAIFVLVLLGTTPSSGGSITFGGFAAPVVFFLMGAVALGAAVESTGLAGRIATLLVRSAGGSPSRLYIQMLASLPGLAFLMPSAITRNAVLIPAYRDTLSAMGIAQSDRAGRALMLALGILNPLASSAILTGGVTSMTASAIIGDFSWLHWFALMAVPYYTLILLGGIALRLMVGRFEGRRVGGEHTARSLSAPLSRQELTTIVVLALVSALWLTDFLHGLSPAIPALFGAILLCCPKFGVLRWKDFEGRLSWGLILTVGASLSLSQAMIGAGTVDWMGRQFMALFMGATPHPFVLLIGIIVAAAIIHLAITNLAACVALLVPITMTVAHSAGVNPIVCALIVTIVTDSVILYPVQTASNLIAYETGYFRGADVRRLGIAMLGLTVLVGLCIAIPYWEALGLPLLSP
ncbi:MAG TPA: SLC13 family permease [Xanthobacteraceae bacterium]|nr:SLC13 family permease [Xanthobacteraceae bacterium]